MNSIESKSKNSSLVVFFCSNQQFTYQRNPFNFIEKWNKAKDSHISGTETRELGQFSFKKNHSKRWIGP